jgi:LCP family protein required for cell wall assembly
MRRQILIAVGAVVIVVGILVGWYLISERHVGRLMARGERANVLLFCWDNASPSRLTDAMMVASLAPGHDVALVSLPPDLRVKFSGGGLYKLGSAYATGGAALACEAVSALLGIDVSFYIALNHTGFGRLIDQYGGLPVVLEEAIRVDDEEAIPSIHFNLQPGPQTLEGTTACDYLRYREGEDELGRITRQWVLITALLESGFRSKDRKTFRNVVKAIYPHLETNLSLLDLYDLAELVRGLTPEQLHTAMVPGEPVVIDDVHYLEPRAVALERMVAEVLRGEDLLAPQDVTVAVFNGNGLRLIASRTAEYLRERDFRVSLISNAESFDYDRTYIVVLSDEAKAWILREALPHTTEIVMPTAFEPHTAILAPLVPEGTDLILVAGAGFEVSDDG